MSDVDYKIRKRNSKPKIVHFNRLKEFVRNEFGEADDLYEMTARRDHRPANKNRHVTKDNREQQLAASEGNGVQLQVFSDDSEDESEGEHDEFRVNDDSSSDEGTEDGGSDNLNEVGDSDNEINERPRRSRRLPKYLEDYEI